MVRRGLGREVVPGGLDEVFEKGVLVRGEEGEVMLVGMAAVIVAKDTRHLLATVTAGAAAGGGAKRTLMDDIRT